MLTNKEVNHLHEERNRITRFAQELLEIGFRESRYTQLWCIIATDELSAACRHIDKIILEGSAKDD